MANSKFAAHACANPALALLQWLQNRHLPDLPCLTAGKFVAHALAGPSCITRI